MLVVSFTPHLLHLQNTDTRARGYVLLLLTASLVVPGPRGLIPSTARATSVKL